MVGIRFGGSRDELLTSCITTPPYHGSHFFLDENFQLSEMKLFVEKIVDLDFDSYSGQSSN